MVIVYRAGWTRLDPAFAYCRNDIPLVHRNRAFAGRLKPRGISVLSQQSAGHCEHTDGFGEPLAKWCRNSQVCGTCRPLHTLTALPRDAIDLAGYVTEDDMRPLPTERPRDTTRSSIDWLCGSTPANFLDFFQRNRSGDLHLTISGGQSSMPVSLRFSDRPDFNVDFDDSVKPSMPYDTLFVHTIIHQTRASEHATAAITRDTRDGDAEASTMGRQQFRREIGRFDQRV
ncbi:hypothetical protein DTO006G1_6700 [Penicillium roqueforti]|nr:hypothetical protein CBS147337_3989 [Penicillium roqueforti]KAI2712465.1 hypothetical protein CBS147354_7971 [Penicillium roqueforti]KAI2758486.1 hypothetical protein DTO006G1_6700 [Penicillium roqueforti]KAI3253782.1 hypothetical protein DTO006G7_5476 [Penicillium roqueforti]